MLINDTVMELEGHKNDAINSIEKLHLQEQDEKEKDEVNLTSNEDIDAIQMYDSTIEIVGFIDGIEAPRYVGENKHFKFFKFYINNGCGKRIQIVAWNDEIDCIEHKIKSNSIIHIFGRSSSKNT
ncbi:uncharacterized protein LOC113562119 [Ooceraea biroi]|uniref:uncharacterized protein LOC113562119 n=1 Tax=Ooceraea biroi TaxID=2015173 RepID=UPI000F075D5D|nr:uncharacterized protein LOC113562119 [Ooceraea biroi]